MSVNASDRYCHLWKQRLASRSTPTVDAGTPPGAVLYRDSLESASSEPSKRAQHAQTSADLGRGGNRGDHWCLLHAAATSARFTALAETAVRG